MSRNRHGSRLNDLRALTRLRVDRAIADAQSDAYEADETKKIIATGIKLSEIGKSHKHASKSIEHMAFAVAKLEDKTQRKTAEDAIADSIVALAKQISDAVS